jgi:hypothetical protein
MRHIVTAFRLVGATLALFAVGCSAETSSPLPEFEQPGKSAESKGAGVFGDQVTAPVADRRQNIDQSPVGAMNVPADTQIFMRDRGIATELVWRNGALYTLVDDFGSTKLVGISTNRNDSWVVQSGRYATSPLYFDGGDAFVVKKADSAQTFPVVSRISMMDLSSSNLTSAVDSREQSLQFNGLYADSSAVYYGSNNLLYASPRNGGDQRVLADMTQWQNAGGASPLSFVRFSADADYLYSVRADGMTMRVSKRSSTAQEILSQKQITELLDVRAVQAGLGVKVDMAQDDKTIAILVTGVSREDTNTKTSVLFSCSKDTKASCTGLARGNFGSVALHDGQIYATDVHTNEVLAVNKDSSTVFAKFSGLPSKFVVDGRAAWGIASNGREYFVLRAPRN